MGPACNGGALYLGDFMAKSGFKKSTPIAEDMSALADKSFGHESEQVKKVDSDKDMPTRRTNRLDPLTEKLSESGYFHKMRWHWFVQNVGGVNYPLEVSRFYPINKLAIDLERQSDEMIEMKRQLCAQHGVKYTVMEHQQDFESLRKVME